MQHSRESRGANYFLRMNRILPGAVILAMETGAPILPFRITGTWPFDHVHLWHSLTRRGRAVVRFGTNQDWGQPLFRGFLLVRIHACQDHCVLNLKEAFTM